MKLTAPLYKAPFCTSLCLTLLTLFSPITLADTKSGAEQALVQQQASAYELSDTAVHQLPSANGRHYEVWIDLPASYGKTAKMLPVLFVSDANYAFPLIRSIRNRLSTPANRCLKPRPGSVESSNTIRPISSPACLSRCAIS